MEKNEIKSIVLDQNETFGENSGIIPRETISKIKEYDNSNLIIILTGLRRSGKSTILNLLKEESNNNNIYVNFDDFRLVNFELNDFQKLNELFLEYDNLSEFYFDEIQNIKFWERYVRTMHDDNNKLFVTGSNASMLSKELGTHLTGRSISIEVFPFSFYEFLIFNGFKFTENDLFLTSKKVKIQSYFNDYLNLGGIPEYLKNNQKDYLRFIYEDIINRDIVSRYSITNVKSLKELIHYLASNIGKEFSYNKLKDLIGVKNSTTVKEYIDYFENSYLIFTLNKFDYSLKKQLINPKKVYFIDNGLVNSISFKFSQDFGRILENLVFIELKRRNKEIYYHREKKECDFVIKEGLNIVDAIQVTKSLSNFGTKEREIEGLLDACKSYHLKNGLILTEDEEGVETRELKNNNGDVVKIIIKILPIWKWLLSK